MPHNNFSCTLDKNKTKRYYKISSRGKKHPISTEKINAIASRLKIDLPICQLTDKDRLAEALALLAVLSQDKSNLETIKKEKLDFIDKLQLDLNSKNVEIEKLKDQLSYANTVIDNSTDTIRKKEEYITTLLSNIEDLINQKQQLENNIAKLYDKLEREVDELTKKEKRNKEVYEEERSLLEKKLYDLESSST